MTDTDTRCPALRVEDRADSHETLHPWMQVVGKVRMAHEPMVNHWWQVACTSPSRGLGTSAMTAGDRVFTAGSRH